ncbi:MAG: ATP-binding cassette domain-containing protein [Dongiaceae bacterium]
MSAALADAVPPILPLSIADLTFEAGGRRLLGPLTCVLAAGPRSIVLGPNGAGKSLLLRLCHGLLEPTAGAVRWRVPAAAARRRPAMVFQRPVLLRRSVAENVAYALRLRGGRARDRAARVAAALAATGLAALAGQPARALSGGEQQRLALARAWAVEPEVLFLDEPTASLDPSSARAVEGIVDAIHRAGTKVVMTTHDLALARRLADEILFLHRGRLLERQPAASFFADPATAEASAFLAGTLDW